MSCQLPTVSLAVPTDLLALILAALAALGITIPPLPSIALPALPCPLEAI